MTWYYVKDGEAAGPISDEALLSQLRLGNILPTTLVWRSGMPAWQPAATLEPQLVTAARETSLSPALSANIDVPPELVSGPPPVFPNFFCTMCGTIIPADQLVRISGRAVCAACKPLYVQRAREGIDAPVRAPVLGSALHALPASPESNLADPAVRLVAYILDLVFILVPVMIGYLIAVVVIAGVFSQARSANSAPVALGMMALFCLMGLSIVWMFSYWTFFIGKRGATPGMKIMKVKMIRADGTPVRYGHALGRAVLLYLINAFTMGLTNITAFFDRERRTVVDMLCDTRVVRN